MAGSPRMQDLPEEVWMMIIDCIDCPRSLARLASSSKVIYSRCIAQLYRDIRVDLGTGEGKWQFYLFARTIGNDEHFRSLVRTLCLRDVQRPRVRAIPNTDVEWTSQNSSLTRLAYQIYNDLSKYGAKVSTHEIWAEYAEQDPFSALVHAVVPSLRSLTTILVVSRSRLQGFAVFEYLPHQGLQALPALRHLDFRTQERVPTGSEETRHGQCSSPLPCYLRRASTLVWTVGIWNPSYEIFLFRGLLRGFMASHLDQFWLIQAGPAISEMLQRPKWPIRRDFSKGFTRLRHLRLPLAYLCRVEMGHHQASILPLDKCLPPTLRTLRLEQCEFCITRGLVEQSLLPFVMGVPVDVDSFEDGEDSRTADELLPEDSSDDESTSGLGGPKGWTKLPESTELSDFEAETRLGTLRQNLRVITLETAAVVPLITSGEQISRTRRQMVWLHPMRLDPLMEAAVHSDPPIRIVVVDRFDPLKGFDDGPIAANCLVTEATPTYRVLHSTEKLHAGYRGESLPEETKANLMAKLETVEVWAQLGGNIQVV